MSAQIRKIAVWVEETLVEAKRPIDPPTRKAVAVAVIENPFAGGFTEGSDAADGHRRRAWWPAGRPLCFGFGHHTARRRKLWQGGDGG